MFRTIQKTAPNALPFLLGILFSTFFVGCNIFNPSGDVSIKSSDTELLISEGQLNFRDGDYEKAARRFSAALKNDSTKSEAWYGLAKANLYKNGGDPFTLALTEIRKGSSIPLMDLDSAETNIQYKAIKSALSPLNELARRDTLTQKNPRLRLSDRIVIYSNFSASYAILDYAASILRFRIKTGFGISISKRKNSIKIDAGALYQKALSDSSLQKNFNTEMDSLESNISDLVNEIYPTLSDIVDSAQMIDSAANLLDASLLFYRLGDAIDNDGDGCVDEEILDGIDNDRDGLIDEDLRLVPLVVDSVPSKTVIGIGKDSLDHDRNGIREDAGERTLLSTGTLLFAENFAKLSSTDVYSISIRREIAADTDSTNIRYPLEVRKSLVGRCWNNYTEDDFRAWFRNR